MLKNILITSLRNLLRHKSFSFINLLGLSVSMSLGMLILLIIKDQFTFDNFHPESDRVYRVNSRVVHPDWGMVDFASSPLSIGRVLEEEYSFTEAVVRVSRQLYGEATYGSRSLPLQGLLVDPSFLKVFNFPLAEGDPASALLLPNSLVLSAPMALKLFGSAQPVGQMISIKGLGDFTITGVLKEFPGKTHFEFEVLCSFSTLPGLELSGAVGKTLENWSSYYNNYVYVKLRPGISASQAEESLTEINKKHGVGLKSDGRDIRYAAFSLQPLAAITPGPELADQMGKGMPASFLMFLSVLAGVVLLMSLFNFSNLTIAKSLSRAREIGVRKVVGASRLQVFVQFVGEAVVFALVAVTLSYLMLQLLKLGFAGLSFSQDFRLDMNEDVTLYALFIVFAIGVGIMAGVLPATYLSAFKPSTVLKDLQQVKYYARLTFRKALMLIQFTLSVVFVILVLVVYRQVDFMLTADYGIAQKDNLLISLQGERFEKLASEIGNLPGVERVGGVSHKLGTWEDGSSQYKRSRSDKPFVMSDFVLEENYVENLEMVFVAGRNFDAGDQGSKERNVILNESALAQFGFKGPMDALGQTVYADDTIALQVVGVVRDFHFRPLSNKIGPLALRKNPRRLNYLGVRIHASQRESTIASIKALWKKNDPAHPIELSMMEQEIDDAYRQTGLSDMPMIVGYVAFLVVSLACLGMIGMAMYASQIRAKEVGIRKVMGATVTGMVMLLSKTYLVLIGIAVVIGVPASILLGNMFLEEYPYRIQITPVLIIFSVAIITGLGLVTVWSQTIRVAASNPIKWLRHE
ncbi:MAG: ABC transporter permease [Cyclobacteriaceae bacterium]|nr:ABC transporter permease [Cyclobacteriaceae bacterium]